MAVKIAIVGLSPSSREAPWEDGEWELWGLPWDDYGWPVFSRCFEMHDLRLLESEHSKRKPDYMERLSHCQNLYMQDAYFPFAKRYPFEEVAKTTGAYWNSSIAYAMAMAIHEGADEIGLWGVDMKGDDEYGYQKPNMEYLIGLALGKGIKVHLPQSSPLMKFQAQGPKFFDHVPQYVDRYGWLG